MKTLIVSAFLSASMAKATAQDIAVSRKFKPDSTTTKLFNSALEDHYKLYGYPHDSLFVDECKDCGDHIVAKALPKNIWLNTGETGIPYTDEEKKGIYGHEITHATMPVEQTLFDEPLPVKVGPGMTVNVLGFQGLVILTQEYGDVSFFEEASAEYLATRTIDSLSITDHLRSNYYVGMAMYANAEKARKLLPSALQRSKESSNLLYTYNALFDKEAMELGPYELGLMLLFVDQMNMLEAPIGVNKMSREEIEKNAGKIGENKLKIAEMFMPRE